MTTHNKQDDDVVVVKHEEALSVAGRPLPPVPPQHLTDGTGTLLLFYQYKNEPLWTEKEHKRMIKKVIQLAEQHHIKGRGRIAPEGLNCTLTAAHPPNMRAFCTSLRQLDVLFLETDFKLTDGLAPNDLFHSLSIRKTRELVAYGMAGERVAPSLEQFAGHHLEAPSFHEALQDPDAVVVDVRNHYETVLGHFQPPPGGATFLDPKLRNSIEFPKWLACADTQKQLHNKKVLMYCTGGIRCERATALLNQMAAADPDACQPAAVYELQGGIERYCKTYPSTGGYWKGKNYLFDKRGEQVPAAKSLEEAEQETDSQCCLCRNKWTHYRGKYKCASSLCGVPVIVCDSCQHQATQHPQSLSCELCRVGYRAPRTGPDFVNLKRKAQAAREEQAAPSNKQLKTFQESGPGGSKDDVSKETATTAAMFVPDRLFCSRLPLTVTKPKLAQALGVSVRTVHWMTDRNTGGFYGSCLVQVESPKDADKVLQQQGKRVMDSQKFRVARAKEQADDVWPPANHVEREYPPVGHG